MRKDFKFLPSIVLNGRKYYDYQSCMMLLRRSLHINGLLRRRAKYPAQFVELNGRMYISKDYASLLVDFITIKKQEAAL